MSIQKSLDQINHLEREDFYNEFTQCCGSQAWVNAMFLARPFANKEELLSLSDSIWGALTEQDYLEAFSHHPQIGDLNALRQKFASTAHLASNEQSGTAEASDETLQNLKDCNQRYLEKFGFIFIVCATGKSAEEMLSLLRQRLENDRTTEIKNAAHEQNRITDLRIYKLLTKYAAEDNSEKKSESKEEKPAEISSVTTHVLDTAKGCPAAKIPVALEYQLQDGSWHLVAEGVTNEDGRIMHWMKSKANPGHYKITFDVYDYHKGEGFFPSVTIDFEIKDATQHYHVPLLISPFSYSTYRGS